MIDNDESWHIYVFFHGELLCYPLCCESSPDGAAVHFRMQVFVEPQHRLTDRDESSHVHLFFLREDLYAIPLIFSFHQNAL